jgi:folylpolyglutamate synthase/dihydrofolate synthase
MDLSLTRITTLLHSLHNPHTKFACIHIAGTNGKGSVAAYLSSIYSLSYRVGRYTSPHLVHPRDTISINNHVPSESRFLEVMCKVTQHNDKLVQDEKMEKATSFELLTSAAFVLFAESKVDLAILEVGLGGALDATNVIPPPLACAITSISLDHQNLLGSSVEQIAKHKCGIIKAGAKVVVMGRQTYSEAVEVVRETAKRENVKLVEVDRACLSQSEHCYKDRDPIATYTPPKTQSPPLQFKPPLSGTIQLDNAAIALQIVHELSPYFSLLTYPHIVQGIERSRWPGRLEERQDPFLNRCVILDGAHNSDSAKALALLVQSKRQFYENKEKENRSNSDIKVQWIFAATKGKDVSQMASLLFQPGDCVYFVPFSTPEGMPWISCYEPTDLESLLSSKMSDVKMEPMKSLSEALEKCKTEFVQDTLTVVTGSLYLISDYYRLHCIEPQFVQA